MPSDQTAIPRTALDALRYASGHGKADTLLILSHLEQIGWAIVPKVSTPAMDADGVVYLRDHPADASGCWEVMLEACR